MYNFLTIGFDCSPASALRSLELRNYALPFDWIESNIKSIELCFKDNFLKFHTNLILNTNNTRLMDAYGFQFPHDYPTVNSNTTNIINENVNIISEDVIIDDWMKFYPDIKEKYNRRIKRFNEIVRDSKPIIILCRYKTQHVIQLKKLFIKYFNKHNIYFINAYKEKFDYNGITNIDPEINNVWNDTEIWKIAINLTTQNIL